MNQDTLVLLSGMAPKEPEQWALDEWGAKFEADYPKPWESCGGLELFEACIACMEAVYKKCRFTPIPVRYALECAQNNDTDNQELQAWRAWRRECLSEFTRHEWPLLWAKKRMQAAGVA